MKVNYELKSAMETMRITSLRSEQIKPIQAILAGQDIIVIARTGMGKSLIFELSAVHSRSLTLVIEPTLALIYDQVHKLRALGISANYLDHSRTKQDTQAILHKLQRNELTFLYVTPERLQNKDFVQVMQHAKLYMVVVDEAHCVTEWGNIFRPDYLKIKSFIRKLPSRPVISAFSATITEDDIPIITASLGMEHPQIFRSDLQRRNLILIKNDVTSDHKKLEHRLEHRFKMLWKTIKKYDEGGAMVIYALTTGYVDALYNYLEERYPGEVVRDHSCLKPRTKQQMEMEFLTGKKRIMVATTSFGMGVDLPNIELVLHFNTPVSLIDYIQQTGRAGRDGRKAHCVLFFDQNGDDAKIVDSFWKKADGTAKEHITQRYREMREFINNHTCISQQLLMYMGQNDTKSCKTCTVCAQQRRGEKE